MTAAARLLPAGLVRDSVSSTAANFCAMDASRHRPIARAFTPSSAPRGRSNNCTPIHGDLRDLPLVCGARATVCHRGSLAFTIYLILIAKIFSLKLLISPGPGPGAITTTAVDNPFGYIQARVHGCI